MSSFEPVQESPRRNAVATISGLFAAASLFFSLIALAYHPVPIAVGAALLALVASGMSDRHRNLCLAAACVSAVCFVAGIAIAVTTHNPLW